MNWRAVHAASAGVLLALVVGFISLPSLWRLTTPTQAPKALSGTDAGRQGEAMESAYAYGPLSNVEPLTGLMASLVATAAIIASFLIARRIEAKA